MIMALKYSNRKLGYEVHLYSLCSGVCLILTASLGSGLGCVTGLDCSAGFLACLPVTRDQLPLVHHLSPTISL